MYCPHLVEVEGILNSKPLGYASTDVTNPITLNILLMGRWDAALPQAVYAQLSWGGGGGATARTLWINSGSISHGITCPLFKPARSGRIPQET